MLSFLRKIRNKFIRKRLNRLSPKMIAGYHRMKDGKLLTRTRISSATFIDHPKKFDVGDNVYIGHHCFIEASNGVKMGEGCQLTNFITITSHSSHDSIRLYGDAYHGGDLKGYVKGPIEIGAYTFIGPYTTIMPNTTIGKGCLISAYSFLQGHYPDFSIIKGSPAKVVGDTRKRDERTISRNPELRAYYDKWAKND